MKKVVGVSDLKVSNNVNDSIITHALGSCLGITAYDSRAKVGGMVHVMLPLSKSDLQKAPTRHSPSWNTKSSYRSVTKIQGIDAVILGSKEQRKTDRCVCVLRGRGD